MTFPLAGEGLTLAASAEVMPHTKPAKSDTVAASRTARLKDTRVRFIKAPLLYHYQRPRVCARAVTLHPAPPLLASRGDSIRIIAFDKAAPAPSLPPSQASYMLAREGGDET
jgi:hypothetical protein